MSYGCPIISTPVGGIPEVVNDNGILVRPGESDEIFAAIRRYIDKPQLIRQEGLASLRNVSTYLPDHVMNHLREIYLREIRL